MRLKYLLLPLLCLLAGSAQASEVVHVLSLNVAGLPDMLTAQSNPRERMRAITSQANKYDIVAYQEDFYQSSHLDQHSGFRFRVRATQFQWWDTALPWLSKSGLTLQSHWPLASMVFRKYSKCYGYVTHASDCWVPKGVMCTRTVTNEGVILDLCTTHLDAGDAAGDQAARQQQIVEYQTSLPTPLHATPWVRVETGDFNMNPDNPMMQALFTGRDIVNIDPDGEQKTRDYIMLTHNDLVDLEVLRIGKAPAFDGLSDHPAIEAIFKLEPRRALIVSTN